MSIQPQPSVSLVTLVKTEPATVIKNEPPDETFEEEISTDLKNIDIVYHSLCEDLIKSETVLENLLENKHLESVQTQVLVKAENTRFIKTENITQVNKSEDTSDGNVSRGTGQGVVEVQVSNEHSNALSKLETDEQSVLNFSKDLNGISTRSRKAKQPEKTNFAKCYKTDETNLWEKEKEKIEVIKAPRIHIKSHEYTSLGEDKHVCNHCQHAYKGLYNLKIHIRNKHREVTTMYQCPYCPYKSYSSLSRHIIAKHKNAKDIQWFQCHLCEKKFKIKSGLSQHMKVHLHKQMQDRLALPETRYHCDRCNFKSYKHYNLKVHKLNHLKPEELQYFYCYHCSYKSKRKSNLKTHIWIHFKNGDVPFHCYICDFMTLKRDLIVEHFKKHPEHHSKCDETNYKYQLETPTKKLEKRYTCDKCSYKTYLRPNLAMHKITHLKPEEIEYFHCYHCSYKSKLKGTLKAHILRHYRNKEVPFHCYICDFVMLERDAIVKHFKKHSKHYSKTRTKKT